MLEQPLFRTQTNGLSCAFAYDFVGS